MKLFIPFLPGRRLAAWARALTGVCFLAVFLTSNPAQASSIPISYSLFGTATVAGATATTLTLAADAAGSVLSANPTVDSAWNPITYSDLSVLDLTTGLLSGSFTISLANGDTLTGNLMEDDSAIDASPTQTGPFTQTLTFTGGTGAFVGASGMASGLGFVGTTNFKVSGNGTLNTAATPEPTSAALVFGGLVLIVAGRKKVRRHCLRRPNSGGARILQGSCAASETTFYRANTPSQNPQE